jgi:argininosuccinate lyase
MAGLVESLAVDRGRMREAADMGHITATSVADALVRRGVAFRVAHGIVGEMVKEADRARCGLATLDDAAIRRALKTTDDETARALAGEQGIGDAVRAAASIEAALASADVVGGTAPERVRAALRAARERLGPP